MEKHDNIIKFVSGFRMESKIALVVLFIIIFVVLILEVRKKTHSQKNIEDEKLESKK